MSGAVCLFLLICFIRKCIHDYLSPDLLLIILSSCFIITELTLNLFRQDAAVSLSLAMLLDDTTVRFRFFFFIIINPYKQQLTRVALECLRVLPVLDLLQG